MRFENVFGGIVVVVIIALVVGMVWALSTIDDEDKKQYEDCIKYTQGQTAVSEQERVEYCIHSSFGTSVK